MSHWADGYVGLPYLTDGLDRAGIDCWGLVRLVWAEQLGFVVPGFSGTAKRIGSVKGLEAQFVAVPLGRERALDAAVMAVETFDRTRRKWILAETHIGIVAAPGLVLHVEHDRLSRIEPIKSAGVTRFMRIVKP